MIRILFPALLLFLTACSRDGTPPAQKYDPNLDKPYVAWYHDAACTRRVLPALDSDLPLERNFDYACTDLPCPRYGIQYHINGAPPDTFSVNAENTASIDLTAYNNSQIPAECRPEAFRLTEIGFCIQTHFPDTVRVFNSVLDTFLIGTDCLGRVPWGEEIGIWVVHGVDSMFLSVDYINSHDDYISFPPPKKAGF